MSLAYNPNIDIPRSPTMPDFTKSPNLQPGMMPDFPNPNNDMMAANMFMDNSGSDFMDLTNNGNEQPTTIQGKGGTNLMDLGKSSSNKLQYQANLDMRGDGGQQQYQQQYQQQQMYQMQLQQQQQQQQQQQRQYQSKFPDSESFYKHTNKKQKTKDKMKEREKEKEKEKERDRKRKAKLKDIGKKKIKNLVNDINKSLDDYIPSASIYSDTDQDDYNQDINQNKEYDNEEGSCMDDSSVPIFIKEFIIIILIYVVLSQGFVRKNIGKYITKINPDENGTIPIVGYIIYGAILALAFIFFKMILI